MVLELSPHRVVLGEMSEKLLGRKEVSTVRKT
jgi:hypothetical protein